MPSTTTESEAGQRTASEAPSHLIQSPLIARASSFAVAYVVAVGEAPLQTAGAGCVEVVAAKSEPAALPVPLAAAPEGGDAPGVPEAGGAGAAPDVEAVEGSSATCPHARSANDRQTTGSEGACMCPYLERARASRHEKRWPQEKRASHVKQGGMRHWSLMLLCLLAAACAQRKPTPVEISSQPSPLGRAKPATPAPSSGSATLDGVLPIPARSQATESPADGWCGETALQEALLHLGMWAPQRLINQAGRPVHPDLYSTDIPVALTALGVNYTFYVARQRGFAPFAAWVASAVDEGDPVLAGVKVLPTQHPEWGLDHFVLVVGHGEKGLLVNTTWGDRRWVGDTGAPGLSFKNAVYAIRLHGLSLPANATPARLTLLSESATKVKLRVACVQSVGTRVEQDVVVDAADAARFQCVRLPSSSGDGAAQLSVERSAFRSR